jgi:hypothetical protein
MKVDLSQLMSTHATQPLPVFKDNEYVQPPAVNSALKDSLVEVHFSVKHYRIRKRDSKPMDLFTRLVEQIIILKPGKLRLPSTYKRKNLLEGPYQPKPFRNGPSSPSSIIPLPTTEVVVPSMPDISLLPIKPMDLAITIPTYDSTTSASVGLTTTITVPHPATPSNNSGIHWTPNVSGSSSSTANTSGILIPLSPAIQCVGSPTGTIDNVLLKTNNLVSPLTKRSKRNIGGNSPKKSSTVGKAKA